MMKNETQEIIQELRIRVPELFKTINEFDEEILQFNIEELLRWDPADELSLVPGEIFFTPFEMSDEQFEQFLLFESLFVEYIGASYSDTRKTHQEIVAEINKIYIEKQVPWDVANEIYSELSV